MGEDDGVGKWFALALMMAGLWGFDQDDTIEYIMTIMALPRAQQPRAYRTLIEDMIEARQAVVTGEAANV